MKTISNSRARLAVVAWLLAAPLPVHAQAAEVGFVRIVHAVAAGEGVAHVTVDGEDVFPRGYQLGQVSGGLGLAAGPHAVAFKKNGVVAGTTQVTLLKGETATVIGFAEKLPVKSEDAPRVWRVRILVLRQSEPESGYRMEMVSLCPPDEVMVQAETRARAKPVVLYARRMVAARVDLGKSRAEVVLKVGGETVTTLSPDEPGNYVVVLYEDAAGKVRALSFHDPKFTAAG